MQCQQCGEPVEADARFCGNCGTQQRAAASLTLHHAEAAGMPQYARATAAYHAGEIQAWLSVLCGFLGIIGGLFMAILGLALGVFGLAFGTMARSSPRHQLSHIGIVVSSVAVLTGLMVWVYAASQDPDTQRAVGPVSANQQAAISTPCYAADFATKLTTQNTIGSCTMQAYNRSSLSSSTHAYKVFAHDLEIADTEAFYELAKTEAKEDLEDNLPGFAVDDEGITTFAGSPAYFIRVSDAETKTSVIETFVFREVGHGENVFVIMHADGVKEADLQSLEAGWQWK